ncbi:MAG: hypothetical protein HOV87_04840, partial [Catenulispora sp.]|nr:hypothetical protein [Catenulispora sp.]
MHDGNHGGKQSGDQSGDQYGDKDYDQDGDDTAIFTVGDGTARIEQPELHRLLRGIADVAVPAPRADFYPQVIKRAAVIRRRRRAVRASSVTAVLVAAAVLAPSAAHRLGMR